MAYYDPNKDYSAALSNPNLSASERAQLTSEREAKIADMYGGKEPTMANSNQTFSSVYGRGGSGVSGGGASGRAAYAGEQSTYTGGYSGAGNLGYDPNIDYSNYLTLMMNQGSTDYSYLQQLLNERAAKANNTGFSQYANDDFAKSIQAYINDGLTSQAAQQKQSLEDTYKMLYELAGSMYSQPAAVDTTYKNMAQRLTDAYINMDYEDWTQSDQYKALAERYGHNGKLTMQDVLGQIASRTGGLASSYATTAAQQQYNEYMALLEEAARQSFSDEREQMYNNAQMALNMYGQDYQEYLDAVAQANANRGYAFDLLNQAISQTNYAQQWQNTLDRQAVSDQRYDDETTYNRGQTARTEAQNRIYDYLTNRRGKIADLDPDLIAQSGYTTPELSAMEAEPSAKSPGGSGSAKQAPTNSARYSDIRKAAMAYENADDAVNYLNRMVDAGYITEDEASDIYLVDLGGDMDTGSSGSTSATQLAKDYLAQHPDVAWDSRTVSYYLNGTDLTTEEKQQFLNYLKDHGARSERR